MKPTAGSPARASPGEDPQADPGRKEEARGQQSNKYGSTQVGLHRHEYDDRQNDNDRPYETGAIMLDEFTPSAQVPGHVHNHHQFCEFGNLEGKRTDLEPP